MKYCKDCAHFRRGGKSFGARCFGAPQVEHPVWGMLVEKHPPADAREPEGFCGPEGKHWEAMPPTSWLSVVVACLAALGLVFGLLVCVTLGPPL